MDIFLGITHCHHDDSLLHLHLFTRHNFNITSFFKYTCTVYSASVHLVMVCISWSSVALTKSLLNKDEISASHFSSVC